MGFDLISKMSASSAFNEMMGGDVGKKENERIDLRYLEPYPDQPFRPYPKERLQELAEDIKINGVLSPIIVRPSPDTGGLYQILAGHNRVEACKLAGLTRIPAIIKEADDDQAQLIMVTTNLNQRQELLPSEKAFAYKAYHDATKRQGKRNDLTSVQVAPRLNDKAVTESKDTIKRYIRLTKLIKPLLDMVDKEPKKKLIIGVNLSYRTKEEQETIFDFMQKNDIDITLKQSSTIKLLENITEETLQLVFFNKPEKEIKEIKIPTKTVIQYFPEIKTQDEMQKTVEKALKFFKEHQTS